MADFAKADEAAWARALQALEMNGNSLLDWIRIDFDELGTEQESLRLQMAMDRMSKFMSTLSNLMKKLSDTDESIAQNLK